MRLRAHVGQVPPGVPRGSHVPPAGCCVVTEPGPCAPAHVGCADPVTAEPQGRPGTDGGLAGRGLPGASAHGTTVKMQT